MFVQKEEEKEKVSVILIFIFPCDTMLKQKHMLVRLKELSSCIWHLTSSYPNDAVTQIT